MQYGKSTAIYSAVTTFQQKRLVCCFWIQPLTLIFC